MSEKVKKANTSDSSLGELIGLGVFRTAGAIEVGISQPRLSRMVASGFVEKLESGIFIHRDAEWPENLEFVVACLRVGSQSTIGGLSALFYYGLTDQAPDQTWLMVPTAGRGKYPNYRIIYTNHDPTVEVEDHGSWRVVTIERAIIEAFKYQTKLGFQTALTAARTAILEGKTTEEKLHKAAKKMRLWPTLSKNWEAIVTK